MRPSLRTLSLLMAASMAGLAVAQEPAAKATVRFEAAPVWRLVPALGEQLGMKLSAAPGVDQDVLVIRVKDADRQALLDRIAEVTAGRWVPQANGGLRLEPNDSRRRAEQESEIERTLADIQKSLNDMLKHGHEEDSEQPDPDSKRRMEITNRANVAFVQILRSLNLRSVAAMTPGQRFVFSTLPTAMQRPFSITSQSVQALLLEHNQNTPEIEMTGGEEEALAGMMGQGSQEVQELMKYLMQRNRPVFRGKVNAAPAKVILSVERPRQEAFFGSLSARLTMFDAKGGIIYTRSASLSGGGMFARMAAMAASSEELAQTAEGKPPAAAEDKSPQLKRNPKYAGVQLGASAMANPGAMEKMAKDARALLMKPMELDPLALSTGDVALALADARDLNLVVNLPDGTGMSFGAEKMTENQAVTALTEDEMAGKVENGWLTSRPQNPAATRESRIDRRSLQALVQSAMASGEPSLDQLADFAFSSPGAVSNSLLTLYSAVGLRISSDLNPFGNQWDALRLFGSLPVHQRQQIREGGRIPAGQLSPASLGVLQQLVYGAEASFEVGDAKPEPAIMQEAGMLRMMLSGGMGMMSDEMASSFLEEPTEAMPNGIPPAAFLESKSARSTAFVMSGEEGGFNPFFGTLEMGDLVMLDSLFKNMPSEATGGWRPDLSRFKLGSKTAMDITLHLRPDVRQKLNLSESKPDADTKVYTEQTLPAQVKQELEAKRKRLAVVAEMFGMFGGFGQSREVRPPAN